MVEPRFELSNDLNYAFTQPKQQQDQNKKLQLYGVKQKEKHVEKYMIPCSSVAYIQTRCYISRFSLLNCSNVDDNKDFSGRNWTANPGSQKKTKARHADTAKQTLPQNHSKPPWQAGGFNPCEKYARQIGNLPQIGVKIKNV